jgi:hypothetical protein
MHNLTQYVYDRLGRKTQTVYPDQTSDTTHYDSLGRLERDHQENLLTPTIQECPMLE